MQQEAKPKQPVPNLDDITAGTADVPAVADDKTEAEIDELSEAAIAVRIERYTQDTAERKKYANRVFYLVSGWIGGVGVLLFAQGLGFFSHPFDTTVLTTLIGTSTVSIAGILYTVIKNLFDTRGG